MNGRGVKAHLYTVACTLSFAGFGVCLHAVAEPIQHSPSISVAAESDSNPAMQPDDAESVYRGIVLPAYEILWKLGADEWRANAAIRIERSSDSGISQNRDDPSLGLQWVRRSPRSEVLVEAAYAEESTRITEIDDTGRLTADGTKTGSELATAYSYRLSPRSELSTNASYSSAKYDGGNFTDYALLRLQGVYSYAFSELNDAYLIASASRYDPAQRVSDRSELYTVSLGEEHRFSENLKVNARAGAVQVRERTNENDWNADLGLEYHAERFDLAAELKRETRASGDGGYATSNVVRLGAEFKRSQLTSFGGQVQWREILSSNGRQTTYWVLWADRKISSLLSLSVSLTQRRNEVDEQNAEGRVLAIAIKYRQAR